MVFRMGMKLVVAAMFVIGITGCGSNPFAAQPTATATRTPRPTFTPLAEATSTFVPLPTTAPTLPPTTAPTKAAAVRTATRTPTKKPPTPKPATSAPTSAVPPTAVPPTFTPAPVASTYEFHVNPSWCEHSGMTYIKGIVYLNKDDPTQRYNQAIVALGPPDGATIYTNVKSEGDGSYTFVLSGEGAPPNKGTFGVWLVTPSMQRKSDIGGPIVIDGANCWAGHVDFWK